ncbi:NAD(P)-binding domain-containing protein [Microbispora sp. GKU 823]|uniref:NAD(P)-binding domain-containing protein n=1 Tax=Microbispora sp. GKU 823 TaxID=1652100 RepID=UPI00211782C5|nr:NAD(P)-binding domain-containing protein [Microbispora sp. GKU 823]
MGQAMVRALLGEGHPVTVWNRTASRAGDLVRQGAVLAGTVEEALAAGDLVILSLTDYDAMYAVLEPAAHALNGRVLVNLSSDTPEKTRAGPAGSPGTAGSTSPAGSPCRRRESASPSRPPSTAAPARLSRPPVPPSKS